MNKNPSNVLRESVDLNIEIIRRINCSTYSTTAACRCKPKSLHCQPTPPPPPPPHTFPISTTSDSIPSPERDNRHPTPSDTIGYMTRPTLVHNVGGRIRKACRQRCRGLAMQMTEFENRVMGVRGGWDMTDGRGGGCVGKRRGVR